MGQIKLSKDACMRAITYSNEANEQLMTNISVMDNNVNSQFTGLQDPAFNRYLELSSQMQGMLKQIGGKMEAIAEYCQSVIHWIDDYSSS